jgi:hypothetical protein
MPARRVTRRGERDRPEDRCRRGLEEGTAGHAEMRTAVEVAMAIRAVAMQSMAVTQRRLATRRSSEGGAARRGHVETGERGEIGAADLLIYCRGQPMHKLRRSARSSRSALRTKRASRADAGSVLLGAPCSPSAAPPARHSRPCAQLDSSSPARPRPNIRRGLSDRLRRLKYQQGLAPAPSSLTPTPRIQMHSSAEELFPEWSAPCLQWQST